ncbi:MAG: cytochrome c biogenesis protein CcsA [Bacteriovoracaceae bacterium]|nr:cytochrome c biogenesis protein CcsA [Bacteriovoracaceae bacterium]
MRKIFILFLFFVSLTSNIGHTKITESLSKKHFCSKELESLPIRQEGRVKPLYVHANKTILALSKKIKNINLSKLKIYCLLSMDSRWSTAENIALKARIDHVKLRKLLTSNNQGNHVLYRNLVHKFNFLRSEMMANKKNVSYHKAISTLLNKINLYQDITMGTNWMLYNQGSWESIAKVNPQNVKSVVSSQKEYILKHGSRYLLELGYAKAHLTGFALLTTLIALASLILFKRSKIALILSILPALFQVAGLTMRSIISGRAPITNMYETVLFSGLGALVLAQIFSLIKKDKIFLLSGLSYNLCTLFMINFAGDMLPSAINPLVPVLRDNFWLSTHVTTIILSYGALGLSWFLANIVLIKNRFFNLTDIDRLYYVDLIYLCLKYGTVLLAVGIILGGIWADYSWGRFWGWDPKETWSLIVLCIYMAILHGKYTSWIPSGRFISLTAAAFMSVMMAWFGVNYILASGLHSYGFSQNGAVFLFSFFFIQTLLLIITWRPR